MNWLEKRRHESATFYTNKLHEWKGGNGPPFRANCTICGARKQDPLHKVTSQVDGANTQNFVRPKPTVDDM